MMDLRGICCSLSIRCTSRHKANGIHYQLVVPERTAQATGLARLALVAAGLTERALELTVVFRKGAGQTLAANAIHSTNEGRLTNLVERLGKTRRTLTRSQNSSQGCR
jgi:hypothetical protein